jgi:hypothetical protein
MGSSPSQQKIFRAAVAGIPRVVEAISGLPSKHHPEALAAAGRGYRQTILESGIADPQHRRGATAKKTTTLVQTAAADRVAAGSG